MKILCVIEGSAWDGAKEQTYLFVREMSKYHKVEIAINSRFTKMNELVKSIAKVHFFEEYSRLKIRYNLNNYRRLLRVVNENNYDVIIAQSSISMLYLSLISPWFKRKNNIIAVKRGDTIPNFFSRLLKYRIADEIVLVSRQVKQSLVRHKSHRQPMHAIESGIDLSKYYPLDSLSLKDSNNTRRELGLMPEEKVFINVSNWDMNRKCQQIILQAFAELKCDDCKLILVGNSTNGEQAKSVIADFGLQNKVLCLGFRSDVPELLRASDYFLMSSNSEGIAGALLQAMACGKIVLSTNAGGIKAYLQDGVNGFSVNVNDVNAFSEKLGQLLLIDEQKAAEIRYAAMKTAANYSLVNNIAQWREFLDGFMSRHATGIELTEERKAEDSI